MTTDMATPRLALDLIDLPDNVRSDVGDTSELEGSIMNFDVIEPLIVRANGDGRYDLIAGRRRYAALTNMGRPDAPVHVVDHPDEDPELARIKLQLVENLQRVDLDPVDEASGYAQLKRLGMRQRQIAREIGRSESHISKRLSLLKLPGEVIDLAEAGRLTTEDLYELTKVESAGADIAPIVEQIAATDRDDTTDPHGEIEQMVKTAIRQKTTADKVAEKRAELEATGVSLVEPKKVEGSWAEPPKGMARLLQNPIWDISRDKHEKEPCHAAMVYGSAFRDGVHVDWLCTETARHGPGGDSNLQSTYLQSAADQKKNRDKEAAKRKQLERRAAQREGALRSAARTVLSGRVPAKEKILNLAADWLVNLIWHDYQGEIALELLDLMPPEGAGLVEYPDLSELYETADGPNRLRIILACALSDPLEQASGTWVDEDSSGAFRHLMDVFADFGVDVDIDGYELAEGDDG